MNLDVKLQEENTIFDVIFDDVSVPKEEIVVDGQISLTSKNPIQNKVITAYVNELHNNTRQYVDDIKDNSLTTEHYSIDMDNMIGNNVMSIDVYVTRNTHNEYTLICNINFLAEIVVNEQICRIIDVPFEFKYYDGLIWVNKDAFKKIGIVSTGLQQMFGASDVMWFNTIENIVKNNGFANCEFTYDCNGGYNDITIIKLTLKATTTNESIATYMEQLFDSLFAVKGNKLVLEYSNQKNITTHEVECVTENLPATYSARGLIM